MKLFPTSDNFGIHICNNDSAIVFASPEPTVSREADKIVGCLLKGLLLCASGKKWSWQSTVTCVLDTFLYRKGNSLNVSPAHQTFYYGLSEQSAHNEKVYNIHGGDNV